MKNNSSNQILIRQAEEKDAESFLKIYAPYVKDTAVSFELEVPSLQEFAGRIKNTLENGYPYFAAIYNNQVAGYAYASPFHPRKAYKCSAELSIYINKDFHKMGIGRLLYSHIEDALKKMGVIKVYAIIAASPRNPDPHLTADSLIFHTRLGFTAAGKYTACANKFGLFYDTMYMEKSLVQIPKEKQNPEVMDVYNRYRFPTGITGIRGKWEKGNLRTVVHVCIFNSKGQMLIQQRVEDKESWPGLWDVSIGGHVDSGEKSQQAASRELQEELGIVYDLEQSRPALTVNFSDGYDDFYTIQKDIDEGCLKLQKEEVEKVQWADFHQIEEMIKSGTFIPYKTSLIGLLFDMNKRTGAHTRSSVKS